MHAGTRPGTLGRTTQDFLAARPQIFGIAYRVLGGAVEAEDIVRETWLRWRTTDRTRVDEPAAFLTTVATRPAIDLAKSARVRREAYDGSWLPEPVGTAHDPQPGAERAEDLELAVPLLLEKQPPMSSQRLGRWRDPRLGRDPGGRTNPRVPVSRGLRPALVAPGRHPAGRGERPARRAGLVRR
ncbi:sigma factor [Streptomyces sp. NPDC088812]|uniref:sigma factor n=1 Tax=Streptomyces sp. NPDC088812 TaxID=3365905 RepID=UPI00381D064E